MGRLLEPGGRGTILFSLAACDFSSFREGDYKALLYRASVRAPVAHFSLFFLLRQSVRIVADHSEQGGWIVYGSDLLDLHVLAQEASPHGLDHCLWHRRI